MTEERDIKIEVKFACAPSVPADVISDVLDWISEVIWRAEEEELEFFIDKSEWPPALRDAMRYRLAEVRRGMSFSIEGASTGSIILAGAAAGLAYWIADKTIGETVKQAWLESAAHEKLKELFKSRLTHKADRIAEEISTPSYRRLRRSQWRRSHWRGSELPLLKAHRPESRSTRLIVDVEAVQPFREES